MNIKDLPWHLLQTFMACVDQGSLSAAAQTLGLSQPTLSRQVRELEAKVQGRLFVRSRQGLSLTPLGLELAEPARAMADAAARVSARLSGLSEEKTATVRLTASQYMATFWLPEILVAFQVRHPHIQVELVANDQTSNLHRREADIALRMFRPTQEGLITRHLGDIDICMLTTEAYLAEHGISEHPEGLRLHRLVGDDQNSNIIDGLREFGLIFGPEDFDLRCDDQVTALHLIAAGGGIGFGQAKLAAKMPGIVALPIGEGAPSLPLWLTAHEELRSNRAVRLLYDFLAEQLNRAVSGRP